MEPGPDVIIIKKKAKGHAAHGAAWKVAYADFVTAMMALFMVLWLVSQTDKKIKKAISEYFRTGVFSGAPSILEGGMGVAAHGYVDTQPNPKMINPVESDDAGEKFMRSAVARALDRSGFKGLGDHVTIRATPEGTLLQIAEGRDDMLFDLSSAELKPPLVKLLAGLAPELTKLGAMLEIHGHTDARPFANSAGRTNWTLSFERADAARAELEKNGLPPALIRGVFAHGSSAPIDPDPLSPSNRRLAIFARRAVAPKGGEAPRPESSQGAAKAPAPATSSAAVPAASGKQPPPAASSKEPPPAASSKESAAASTKDGRATGTGGTKSKPVPERRHAR